MGTLVSFSPLIDTAAVLKKEIRVVSRAKFWLAHLSFPFTDSRYLEGEFMDM